MPVARGSFRVDLEYGLIRENNVLEKIRKYFNDDTISKTKDRFSKYDFESQTCKYELKSRKNTYRAYPTTIIPCNKIVDGKLIFLFNFIEDLYFIEYDKETFDRFEKIEMRDYRAGRYGQTALHFAIPIDLLTQIKI